MRWLKCEHRKHIVWEPSLLMFHSFQEWWSWWKQKVEHSWPGFQLFHPYELPKNCLFHSSNYIHDHCVFSASTQRSCHMSIYLPVHTAKVFTGKKTPAAKTVYRSLIPHTANVITVWYITTVHMKNGIKLPHKLLNVVTSNPHCCTYVSHPKLIVSFYTLLPSPSHDHLKLLSVQCHFTKAPIPIIYWHWHFRCTPCKTMELMYLKLSWLIERLPKYGLHIYDLQFFAIRVLTIGYT